MTKRDRITQKALQLISAKRDGLQFTHLVAALAKDFPTEPTGTLTGYTWNLHRRFPDEIYKPKRGLFRSVKFRSNDELEYQLAAEQEAAITIDDYTATLDDIGIRFPNLKRDDLFTLWFLVAHLVDDETHAAQGAGRSFGGQRN